MSFDLGKITGADGKGITSITKTGTSGLIDTYTITYTDGTTSTFTVTNGSSGADIVTEWESTLSDSKVPSEKLVKNTIDNKASTNHSHGNLTRDGKVGSTSGKAIITGTGGILEASSLKTINNESIIGSGNIHISGGGSADIVTEWESTLSDEKVPSEKLVKNTLDTKANSTHSHSISDVNSLQTALDGKASSTHNHSISDVTNLQSSLNAKANSSDLGIVATSNSYTDLDDIPTSFTPSSHTHTKSEITDFTHSHSISDVTNLQTNLDAKINTSDIANNLTTTTSGKVLDARQGKILADLIGDAIDYINL